MSSPKENTLTRQFGKVVLTIHCVPEEKETVAQMLSGYPDSISGYEVLTDMVSLGSAVTQCDAHELRAPQMG